MGRPMTPFAANPFIFIFAVVLLIGVALYFSYGMLDRSVSLREAQAVVTGKQYYPPGVTYNTNIVAGRAWTQATATSDIYALALTIAGEPTAAAVPKQQYDAIQSGDTVTVRMRRTRFSDRLEVTEVLR